ncbi:MAG TPA: helix-hairpin-helix domain-containing protein [Puia sp.]|nr:helix-hairpin-helix domain-containing protein [Puia sp.]
MWETIRGYLTFTRKERFGVLFLLLVICILFVLPYFFRPSVGQPDQAAYDKMKKGILKFESGNADSSGKTNMDNRYPGQKNAMTTGNKGKQTEPQHSELFYFDPNNLNLNEWRRLGLPERLIQTILRYIEKGGHFRKAEDMKKLYGLQNSEYQRLSPYVRIMDVPNNFRPSPYKDRGTFFVKKFIVTDINLADSADWSRLPGIGEKLASRIVHFREKLGGFYQVDQVAETFGLPDSSFQMIKPFLRLNTLTLNQINLNTATKEILQSHPYIRWQFAKAILEYRTQHGDFHSVDDLLQIATIDSAKFEKLKPYFVVGVQ